jgi:SAM-dependent methyltransferase
MAFNKNGEISFHKTKSKPMDLAHSGHDREKKYIIEEGDDVPVLIELGIFTKERKIVERMHDKFRQINRFIELFDDMSENLDGIYKRQNKINLVDFGCGKSYLTFVLYHYLAKIKKFSEDSINIVGVDLKEKVVGDCNLLARKYGYKNLAFEAADIEGYEPKFAPDVAVSLHGCDTATDHALYNALKWHSELIFAAPCCEHEVNAQIDAAPMANILKYGIVKERFSALLTNAIRCNILELENYKTELIEFVDISHSPKNLLIRAKKTTGADRSKKKLELEGTLEKFGINQTLYNLFW